MRRWIWCILVGSTLLAQNCVWGASAENEARISEIKSMAQRIHYKEGQIELRGGLATLHLTEEFRYVDPAGTETILTGIWGNPSSSQRPLGLIVPKGFSPFATNTWCVVVSFEEDGYIKDDDAAKLNYAKLLKQMQESTKEANAERVKSGYPSVELIGWATPPRYDAATHKLFWAKEIKFGDASNGNTLNYNLRYLGREGVLVLNVVSGMSQFKEVEAAAPELLRMVDFNEGHRYADYKPGTDKVATYGLAALVAGGIAAKTGLLKGLLLGIVAMKKFIIIGLVAAGGAVSRIFKRRDA